MLFIRQWNNERTSVSGAKNQISMKEKETSTEKKKDSKEKAKTQGWMGSCQKWSDKKKNPTSTVMPCKNTHVKQSHPWSFEES